MASAAALLVTYRECCSWMPFWSGGECLLVGEMLPRLKDLVAGFVVFKRAGMKLLMSRLRRRRRRRRDPTA